jgi:hypothetical protein
MNATDLLKTALLHNGMNVGEDTPQMTGGTVLSYMREQSPSKNRRKSKLPFLFLTAIIIFTLAGYASASQEWVYRKMDMLLLIPREEPFTALHFEYYDDLPNTAVSGEMIDFTFTIKNSEGIDKEYLYYIYFKDNMSQENLPVKEGKAFIKEGESATISESYIPTRNFKTGIISVTLPEGGQAIHFIINNDK